MSAIEKHVDEVSEPFWRGLTHGELKLQRCTGCGYVRHPISWLCPECLSDTYDWQVMSGRGTVETFIWYFEFLDAAVGELAGYQKELPYNVAAIRLEEGPSLISNVQDVAFGELEVGANVSAVYDPVADDWALLRFVVEV
jgi:uncharacterized OB-fold protein